ncbi:hypothetical protein DUNSADRAFT_3682 [Dunaliella salina]|uniref:Encoded protein n=1 Tax=Dunaliella salina TaxID=3046 RepID=A0ABQ7FVP3_DUNSA|nr:hypothetical protein DUNSADRAFT_3682 [Dunaliella salina]|eukprot:KAF5826301.1 hypothetical protein DUNSADRAFT_3682 [Dunaliella salina]
MAHEEEEDLDYEDKGDEEQEEMMEEGRAERQRERSPAHNRGPGNGRPVAPNPRAHKPKINLQNPDRARWAQLRVDYPDNEPCGHNGHHGLVNHTNGACFRQEWWRHGTYNHRAPRPIREQAIMPAPRRMPTPAITRPAPPAGNVFNAHGTATPRSSKSCRATANTPTPCIKHLEAEIPITPP